MSPGNRIILLIAASASLFAGCVSQADLDDLNKRLEKLEKARVSTVDEQVDRIEASIADLEAAKEAVDGKVDDLFLTYRKENNDILLLRRESQKLDKSVSGLKTYVESLASSQIEWAEGTFATVEQMSGVLTRLAAVEQLIPGLEPDVDAMESRIQEWVGVRLDGFVTTAGLQAAVELNETKFEGDLEFAKDSLATEVTRLKTDIRTAVEQLTGGYTAALGTAISDCSGNVSAELTAAIKAAKDSLDADVADLQGRVTALEEKVAALEGRMDAVEADFAGILTRIQSVAVVPTYSDGSVRMSTAEPSTVRFEVSPASAAKALVNAEGAKSFFSFQAVEAQTRASAFTDFTITSVAMDAADEFVEVTLAPNPSLTSASTLMARLLVEANSGKPDYVSKSSDYFFISPYSPVPVTGVTLDRSYLMMKESVVERLHATVYPDNATNKDLIWTSSNPDIIMVDVFGMLTCFGGGHATITVTTADGGLSASCLVASESFPRAIVYSYPNPGPSDFTTFAFYNDGTSSIPYERNSESGNLFWPKDVTDGANGQTMSFFALSNAGMAVSNVYDHYSAAEIFPSFSFEITNPVSQEDVYVAESLLSPYVSPVPIAFNKALSGLDLKFCGKTAAKKVRYTISNITLGRAAGYVEQLAPRGVFTFGNGISFSAADGYCWAPDESARTSYGLPVADGWAAGREIEAGTDAKDTSNYVSALTRPCRLIPQSVASLMLSVTFKAEEYDSGTSSWTTTFEGALSMDLAPGLSELPPAVMNEVLICLDPAGAISGPETADWFDSSSGDPYIISDWDW